MNKGCDFMKVKEIAKKLCLTPLCVGENEERIVSGCHIGDLLSLVMSKAQSGDAWITIQGNINVCAVASLTDCAMVIIAEGIKLDENAKMRAEQEGICIYSSDKSAFSLACDIKECL